MSATGRSGLAALSLANILLIRIWVELLGEQTDPAPPLWFGAALINLLLLGGLIWAVVRWGGLAGRYALAIVGTAWFAKEFTIAGGHQVERWKYWAAGMTESGVRHGWLWPLALLALAVFAWIAGRTQLRWVAGALVMLSPILVVTAGQATWCLIRPAGMSVMAESSISPPSRRASNHPRVVWIIFDEFDERIAFAQRPRGLRLPALDAFRTESIVFRQAFSPSDSTAVSIPLLVNHLLDRPGLRAGVVGWYIPYCQKYRQLASCQAWPMNRQLNSYGSDLATAVSRQWRSFFESSLYSVFGQSLAIEAHVRTIQEMETAAAELAVRPDLDLVLLHLPAPHTPYVYSPEHQDFSARNQDARGYLNNLVLADRLFARIRTRLTQTGSWATTHVLVTGDHGFRQAAKLGYPPEDLHVPLMWKPAGSPATGQIDQRFDTKDTASLISRLLDGETTASVLAGYP